VIIVASQIESHKLLNPKPKRWSTKVMVNIIKAMANQGDGKHNQVESQFTVNHVNLKHKPKCKNKENTKT
jgi:hypothetical protein